MIPSENMSSDCGEHVIAFPKNASASCPMTEAPGTVTDAQLSELHIQLRK